MQLKAYYWMDFASALTPLLLDPQPGHRVLDMCATPGGKSLILSALLFPPLQPQQQQQQQQPEPATSPTTGAGSSTNHAPQEQHQPSAADGAAAAAAAAAAGDTQPLAAAAEDDPTARWRALTGQLTCNEADSARRARLTRVLKEYLLPDELERARITQNDGAGFWQRREGEEYDRVLLDAPCSSDRHVVQHNSSRSSVPKSQWSLATCRKLAAVQLKVRAPLQPSRPCCPSRGHALAACQVCRCSP
jgi:16S rRNA C967 or C1407 C5-methylase (RsmB/RsmF family)